jgi:hypothetical protein
MADLAKALETQLANIEKRSGRSLEELSTIIKSCGLAKHGEIRDMLKTKLKLGHGDANTLVHVVFKSYGQRGAAGQTLSTDLVVDGFYTGPKAELRPIHDKLMGEIRKFGSFEIAPKKTYLSLRRKKQFATIGPATNTRVDVGLNMKGVKPTGLLEQLPPGGMCQYRVKLTSPSEVTEEVIGWIRQAYVTSG